MRPSSYRATFTALSLALLTAAAVANPPIEPRMPGYPAGELTNPRDGSAMVIVPYGTYTIGADDHDRDEKPQHQVSLRSFAIGKHAVTNAQWDTFVRATHYSQGPGMFAQDMARLGPQAPFTRCTWFDARAYCGWAGARLPTEAEWEAAARGTDARKYPWGNGFEAGLCCNSFEQQQPGPRAVGSYPEGASPYGCLDMVGNVWQWCSSKARPYPYSASDGREDLSGTDDRILHGGGWGQGNPKTFLCSNRLASSPSRRTEDRGVRIARSL